MLNLILIFVQIVTTVVRLAGPGGVRSVVAESVLMRHQLLVLNRSRRRAPNLGASDRLITGWCCAPCLAATTDSLRNCRETIDCTKF